MSEVRHVNCLLTDGGLGDMVAALTAIKYIDIQYRHVRQHVWVPDYALNFVKLCLPKIRVRSFSDAKSGKYDRSKPSKHTRWDGRISPMKIHLIDYAFLTLCDELPDIEHKNYVKPTLHSIDISKFNLPKKYVVITTGYTAENRQFLPKVVNEVSEYCRQKDYTIVYLGKTESSTGEKHVIVGEFKKDQINYTNGIDLIDKTNLCETAKIISEAACIIGLDNGLLHIAGCTDVPIVGGFTNVHPKTRMPYRNNELGYRFYPVIADKSLSCNFCQTRMNFLYGHDFKTCYYKNYDCLSALTTEKWIEQINRALEEA